MYSLSILEARTKMEVAAGLVSSESSRALSGFLGGWQSLLSLACGCISPITTSAVMWYPPGCASVPKVPGITDSCRKQIWPPDGSSRHRQNLGDNFGRFACKGCPSGLRLFWETYSKEVKGTSGEEGQRVPKFRPYNYKATFINGWQLYGKLSPGMYTGMHWMAKNLLVWASF